MTFNPVRMRQVTEEGGLARVLRTQYDSKFPMGNFAQHDLAEVISIWLVGLQAEVSQVIPRSLQWLDKAIDGDEKFGPDQNAHRTTLHWAKAIGQWLEDGSDDVGEWNSARVFEEARWRYEKRPWSTSEIIKYGLDDYMAFAYQGGEAGKWLEVYEAGIEMYERWADKTEISLSKVLKPRDFGYALCLHRTARQQFDEEDLFKAGRKMLQANLQNTWLGGGQYVRAATWLKIVYWHYDETLTPLQVILKAYDNMPNVPRPDFVPLL
ncbi:hypothetical protein [Collimonas humicola]|uniref:hypothetical protein n=1 Tax=Collimonas humicola TaxID=2825886 RepID=UPI001B8D1FE9|nr:hypothetical protein [Collimonas humicola]